MRKKFLIPLALCGMICATEFAFAQQASPDTATAASAPTDCRDLEGQEKKACIREIKKAHAAKYRDRIKEQKNDISTAPAH